METKRGIVTLASSPDDAVLLQRAAQGDENAFERLYARHSTALFNYLLRLVRHSEIAEEILQETFIAVWQQAALFEGRSAVKTWIFRIGHHKAVSWLRRNREHLSLDESILPEGGCVLRESADLRAWEEVDALRQALDSLSPKHRAVVELAYGQGMTYKEIAWILGCPVGTVKSRMKYALQHLEGILRRSGFAP